MEESVTVQMDGIGPILVERSKRAKRIVISIKPKRGVKVTVPKGVSFRRQQISSSQRSHGFKSILS